MYDRSSHLKLAVIGLGYVGLPLAIAFAKHRKVIGFDINKMRIADLIDGKDETGELEDPTVLKTSNISLTCDEAALKECSCYIITVPTPIDESNKPDLSALQSASELIGKNLSAGDVVIYESTVYPGLTEEICIPILEESSGLKVVTDDSNLEGGFVVGYSPERINPGDKERKIGDITKVVSASSPAGLDLVDSLYSSIINVGTYRANSIKVAEAAKVIENTQRDVNIALVNELALIFDSLGINTRDVLAAARTKWNFLNFVPGLVGGHCIGVDPYYLTHKAAEVGYTPEIILSGRRLNDSMGQYVATRVAKLMVEKDIKLSDANVLVLGLTFKENCPDIRNSKVFDVINGLLDLDCRVDVFDPIVEVQNFNFNQLACLENIKKGYYEAVVLAVSHDEFLERGVDWIKSLCTHHHVIFDLKSVLPDHYTHGRL